MSRQPWVTILTYCSLLTLCGCLPNSCAKVESRELFPADSLSRSLAEIIVDDTLRLTATTVGMKDLQLEYPRTILFDEDGNLIVGDVARGSIHMISSQADSSSLVTDNIDLPFLLGVKGDTLSIFDAATNSFKEINGTDVVNNVALQGDIPKASVRYAARSGSNLFIKVVPDEGPATIIHYSLDGNIVRSKTLDSPSWQWAGLMRPLGDSIVSFRGYQPRFDIFDDQLELDSLNLVGFDSPMLARTRNYLLGDAKAPPLLTPSAALTTERFFVLNIRPGWTRIDVFDRSGRITDVLIREEPSFNKDFYPTDIAVFQTGDNSFIVAVSYVKPDARIEFYEWSDVD